MMPLEHLIASLIVSLLAYPIFEMFSFLIILTGVFVDVDHYLLYVYKFRSLDLKKAFDFHISLKEVKKGEKQITYIYVFHSFEFMLLLLLLSFYSIIFVMLFLGVILHVIMDWIYDYKHPNKKIVKAYCVLLWLLKRQ